jgi:hypothetical protein
MNNYETVTLDLDRDTLANLALYANDNGITINDAVIKIIKDYIGFTDNEVDAECSGCCGCNCDEGDDCCDELGCDSSSNDDDEDYNLKSAIREVLICGVNHNSLYNVMTAYEQWFNESSSGSLVGAIFEDAEIEANMFKEALDLA